MAFVWRVIAPSTRSGSRLKNAEHGHRTHAQNRCGSSGKRDRRDDHFIARADIAREKRRFERKSSIRERYAVLAIVRFRKRGFEHFYGRAIATPYPAFENLLQPLAFRVIEYRPCGQATRQHRRSTQQR